MLTDGAFGDFGGIMNDMMNMRNRMLQNFNTNFGFDTNLFDTNFNFNIPRPEDLMRSGNASGVCYSSQQFYNSEDPSQNFQKTSATQFAPGVLEAREAERNNRENLERMSVRRQLGDKSTEVERKRNMLTGEEFVDKHNTNIYDGEENQFDQQWMTRAQQTLPRIDESTRMLLDNSPTFSRRIAPLAISDTPGTELRDRSTRTSQRSTRSRDTFTA